MTRRRAVVLCEDRAHWHFARAYLDKRGWNTHQLQPKISPSGGGSAEQWVRNKYPQELQAHRAKAGEEVALIVIVDADMRSRDEHIVSLEKMGTRRPEDRVAFFVPRRNIETWIAYLEGESVDEEELKDYKTFKRGHSRTKPAKELARRCIQSPPSKAHRLHSLPHAKSGRNGSVNPLAPKRNRLAPLARSTRNLPSREIRRLRDKAQRMCEDSAQA